MHQYVCIDIICSGQKLKQPNFINTRMDKQTDTFKHDPTMKMSYLCTYARSMGIRDGYNI